MRYRCLLALFSFSSGQLALAGGNELFGAYYSESHACEADSYDLSISKGKVSWLECTNQEYKVLSQSPEQLVIAIPASSQCLYPYAAVLKIEKSKPQWVGDVCFGVSSYKSVSAYQKGEYALFCAFKKGARR